MKTEDRVLRLENAFSTLVELARTQSERIDESDRRTEFPAELAKTQSERMDGDECRTEELAQAQKALVVVQRELAEAQRQTETNLSALTVAVADLERALANLAERFDKRTGDN